MAKRIGIIFLICVLIGAMLWQEHQREQEKGAFIAELNCEVRDYKMRKSDLENQKQALEEEYEEKLNGIGAVTLIFSVLDETFYTKNWPAVKEHGISGVLALSETQFPGEKGCITAEQLREIIDSGFGYCLSWDGVTELPEWFCKMKKKLDAIKLDMPTALLISKRSYSDQVAEDAKKQGIKILVRCEEAGFPLITEEDPQSDEIWEVGVFNWAGNGATSLLQSVSEKSGCVVLNDTVNYMYRSNSLLENLPLWQEEGSILVLNFEELYAYRKELSDNRGETEAEFVEKKQELQEQMDAIDEAMDGIYARYSLKW